MALEFKYSAPDLQRVQRAFEKEMVSLGRDIVTMRDRAIQRRYRGGTGARSSRTSAAATLARRSGRLAGSTRVRVKIEGTRIEATNFIPRSGPFYATVHEHGAVIRGRPLLKFKTRDGKWVSARFVVIPARPVWRTVEKETKRPILKRADVAVDRIAKAFNGG